MALDKAIGLLGAYKEFLTKENIQYIEDKSKILSEGAGDTAVICFGYSKSGYRFIALCTPLAEHDFDYYKLQNQLRKDDKEAEFLSSVATTKLNYYCVDLFAENLINGKTNDIIRISLTTDSNPLDKKTISPLSELNDSSINSLLLKYGKGYCNPKEIKINKWNTIFFNDCIQAPIIKVNVNGEDITLKNYGILFNENQSNSNGQTQDGNIINPDNLVYESKLGFILTFPESWKG